MVKIVVRNQKQIKITDYEAIQIPMVGDMIDLPHKLGIVKVISRVFYVDNLDEVVLIVKR